MALKAGDYAMNAIGTCEVLSVSKGVARVKWLIGLAAGREGRVELKLLRPTTKPPRKREQPRIEMSERTKPGAAVQERADLMEQREIEEERRKP